MELRSLKVEHQKKLDSIEVYKDYSLEQWKKKIEELYVEWHGVPIDLDNPLSYNEKIQWRKLYDQDPIYGKLYDKYAVRKWVERKIGRQYLIPLLGVWEKAKDIDFNRLPEQYVLKTNNATRTNIIVKDSTLLDKKITRENLDFWLLYPFWCESAQLHYRSIKPVIIAEKYMAPDNGEEDLRDYKFICFDGKPYYCWVDADRYHGHKRKVFDIDWKPVSWTVGPHKLVTDDVRKPERFEEMIQIVKILCAGFSHVRVDLYEIGGQIYFGEMTFTSSSGMEEFSPASVDYEIGKLWDISHTQVDRDKVKS